MLYEYAFGAVVAIDDDMLVVGAPLDNHQGCADVGSVYIFRKTGGDWVQDARLTASDNAKEDHFGNSVAVVGNRVIVGSPFDNPHGEDSGSVYVFEYDSDTGWYQKTKLIAQDGEINSHFGWILMVDDGFNNDS